jgi:hypothetical protein
MQTALNKFLLKRLNKRTPMQVLTGHAKTTPLALLLMGNVLVNEPLEYIEAQKRMIVDKLSRTMAEIHAQVVEKTTRDLKVAIEYHNNKTHVSSSKFQVGDFVLVEEHRKSSTSRLQVKWKGPRRIASVESDYMFVVENLLTRELKELKAAHATRLQFYQDK